MLLRRIREHVKTQNWIAVGIDFIIVVFGVFMGLQVQEWNQHRLDLGKERDYLDRLSSDFAGIERRLQQCLTVYKDSLEAIDFVSQTISNRAEPGQASMPDHNTFAAALIRMTAGMIPASRAATFVEMASSGDLNILRDEALRNALIAYDQQAETNRETWRSLRNEASEYGRPLYENVDLRVDPDQRSSTTILSYDLTSMASDPAFRSMLNVFAGTKGNNYELCQLQLELATDVQALIEKDRPSGSRPSSNVR